MTEIEIKNFQSIKKVNFCIDGFTVIVGKNNIGKSAIIRAIEAALTNQAGNNYIRRGEKQTEVKIKKDSLDILWKKNESASYVINKESFKKLNRGIPKPLMDAGYEKIEMGDDKVFPLVASQFEPLFLINQHGSTITEVLASLYNIDTLSIADDLCQKALHSNKSLLKIREKDFKTLQEKFEKFKDFEQIKKTVNDILEEEKRIKQLESEINELISYEIRISELTKSLKKLKPIYDIKISNVSKYEKNFTEIQEIQKYEKDFIVLSTIIEQLKNITDITIPLTTKTEKLSTEVAQLSIWETIFISLKENVKQKKDILKVDIDSIIKSISNTTAIIEELSGLQILDKEFTTLILSAKDTRNDLRTIIEEYDKKYEILSKEICPTCKRPYENRN